jgi:hypothetical protein
LEDEVFAWAEDELLVANCRVTSLGEGLPPLVAEEHPVINRPTTKVSTTKIIGKFLFCSMIYTIFYEMIV